MPTLILVTEFHVAVQRILTDAVSQLQAAEVPLEALAQYVPVRRVMLIRRPPTMEPVGEVWRLGTLLLSPAGGSVAPFESVARHGSVPPRGLTSRRGSIRRSGSSRESEPNSTSELAPVLYAAGNTTRAAKRLHPNNQSVSREQRRDIAAAALHGGYPEGTPVHFDARLISLEEDALRSLGADSPVGVLDGSEDGAARSIAGDEVRVRWRAGAPLDSAPSLREYLAERIDLLINTPQGA